MSIKSLFSFTGLFCFVTITLALVCASCSSPVSVQSDPTIAKISFHFKNMSFANIYVSEIVDSVYAPFNSKSILSDTTFLIKKTNYILIHAYVTQDAIAESFGVTVEHDTTLTL